MQPLGGALQAVERDGRDDRGVAAAVDGRAAAERVADGDRARHVELALQWARGVILSDQPLEPCVIIAAVTVLLSLAMITKPCDAIALSRPG